MMVLTIVEVEFDQFVPRISSEGQPGKTIKLANDRADSVALRGTNRGI
jgi:hypothetical protein